MRAFQGTFAVDIWSIKCCVVDIWSIFGFFFGGRYSIKPQWPACMEQLPGLLAAAHGGGGATGGATIGQPGAAVAAAVGQLEPCHLGRDKMKRYNSGEIGKRSRSLRWHS